jgi:hypothetical protein
MNEHLDMTVSDRGLRYLPAIPATHGGRVVGQVEVYESSAAEAPHIWLKVTTLPSAESLILHLSVEDADRLGEQLRILAGEVERDWALDG